MSFAAARLRWSWHWASPSAIPSAKPRARSRRRRRRTHVLFCLTVLALIVLFSPSTSIRSARACALPMRDASSRHDPYAAQLSSSASKAEEHHPDPMRTGPARDASNPRFRPDVVLPQVPDPFYPSLEKVRAAAAATDVSTRLPGETSPSGQPDVIGPPPEQSIECPPPLLHNEPPPSLVSDFATSPIAGWYQDPEGSPGSLRYWDGSAWTERRPA